MRKSILSAVAGVTFLLGIAACSEENKYDSSVVTDIQLYLDDEAYSLNTGSSNKPLFIYVVLRKKKKNHVAILICCVYAIALIILYMLDGFYTPLYKLDSVVIKSISIAMISCVVFLIIICMMCLLHFMSSEEGAMEKQAQFDALTELPNRFYMMAKLKNLFEADKQ